MHQLAGPLYYRHTLCTHHKPPTMAAPSQMMSGFDNCGLRWGGAQLFQHQCPAKCLNTPNRILIPHAAWGQWQTGVVFECESHPGWFLIDWLLTSGQTASVCSQNDPSCDAQLRVDDVIVEVGRCKWAKGDRRANLSILCNFSSFRGLAQTTLWDINPVNLGATSTLMCADCTVTPSESQATTCDNKTFVWVYRSCGVDGCVISCCICDQTAKVCHSFPNANW